MTSGLTFDAGGLLALDRGDRRIIVLLARAEETGATMTVPATALAQAIRRPERQVQLARLIRQPKTDVVALDRVDATGRDGRVRDVSLARVVRHDEVCDAHVVICARRQGQRVVTSDPGDLRGLDPSIDLLEI